MHRAFLDVDIPNDNAADHRALEEYPIVECYVCHEAVAVPVDADRGNRWIHRHCSGNAPTVSQLVIGFLAACRGERFCIDCLARLVGVPSRKELEAGLASLSDHVTTGPGRCARCPARTRVARMHADHNGDDGHDA
jgi:hypothetical protein